jgi:ABC-2 type transport system ATP-binding protein
MAEADQVIEVNAVRKTFGPIVALDGLSLSIGRGEMFGVIGPDGAGKTTALRLICGLLAPDAGEIRVLGGDPYRTHRAATAAIGYVSQQFSLYGDLSIDENIEFFARIHGVIDLERRRQRLLALTGLEPFRTRLAERLSGGMKQKLALACTLVHQPPILVLDEPTTGVDPVSRREFWKLLAEFLGQGLTIVMATPYLDEAERCGRIVLLDAGRALALDEPARLQASLSRMIFEVVTAPPRRALDVLRTALGPDRVQLFGDRLHVWADREDEVADVERVLEQHGCAVTGLRRIVPTLEDVFIERVARASRESAALAPSAGESTASETRTYP